MKYRLDIGHPEFEVVELDVTLHRTRPGGLIKFRSDREEWINTTWPGIVEGDYLTTSSRLSDDYFVTFTDYHFARYWFVDPKKAMLFKLTWS